MKPILLALCAAITLSGAPAAYAEGQGKHVTSCGFNQKGCAQPGKGQPPRGDSGYKAHPQVAPKAPVKVAPKAPVKIETKKAHNGPRIGDNARGAKVFQHSKYKKVKAPPRGQEYRVIDDRVVLVNKDTLRVISIIGLVSALTR